MIAFQLLNSKTIHLIWIAVVCIAFQAGKWSPERNVGVSEPSKCEVESTKTFVPTILDIDLSFDFKYLPEIIPREDPEIICFTIPVIR